MSEEKRVVNFEQLEEKQDLTKLRVINTYWENRTFDKKDVSGAAITEEVTYLVFDMQPLEFTLRSGNPTFQERYKYSNKKNSVYGHLLGSIKSCGISISSDDFRELRGMCFVCQKEIVKFDIRPGSVPSNFSEPKPKWFFKERITDSSIVNQIQPAANAVPEMKDLSALPKHDSTQLITTFDGIDKEVVRKLVEGLMDDAGMNLEQLAIYKQEFHVSEVDFNNMMNTWSKQGKLATNSGEFPVTYSLVNMGD